MVATSVVVVVAVMNWRCIVCCGRWCSCSDWQRR